MLKSSNGPGNGEINHLQEQEVPTPPPPPNRLETSMAMLLENQNAMMQMQATQQRGGVEGMSLLDRFRRLHSTKFGGSSDPAEADAWLRGVERVFEVMGVTDLHKVSLASFNLKGEDLAWWENYRRQLTTPADGEAPRVVSWHMFLVGFNDKYYPASYRIEQENAFLYLKQGNRSVAEYEAEFVALSRFAV